MHIGVGREVGFVDGLYYTAGLLGRGGIVEVDERLAVHLLTQYGEFFSYLFYVVHRLICPSLLYN